MDGARRISLAGAPHSFRRVTNGLSALFLCLFRLSLFRRAAEHNAADKVDNVTAFDTKRAQEGHAQTENCDLERIIEDLGSVLFKPFHQAQLKLSGNFACLPEKHGF